MKRTRVACEKVLFVSRSIAQFSSLFSFQVFDFQVFVVPRSALIGSLCVKVPRNVQKRIVFLLNYPTSEQLPAANRAELFARGRRAIRVAQLPFRAENFRRKTGSAVEGGEGDFSRGSPMNLDKSRSECSKVFPPP